MASPEYSCPPRKSRPLQASYIRGYGFNLRLPSSTCGRYIQSLDCVYLLFWRIPIHQAPLQSSKSSILLRQMMTTVVLNGLIYTKCEMYLDDCIVFARGHCDPHSCTAVRVPAYVRFGSGTIRAIRFMTCLSLCLSVS